MLNKDKASPESLDLQVIYVKEEKARKGKKPIEWLLAAGERPRRSV
jgi:hypothetical protein